jgi:diguanylate cyclase (GGDEF)-like protein
VRALDPPYALPRRRLFSLRLADWPFAFKMGFLPALSLIVLIGIAGFAVTSLDQQAQLIETVVQQDLDTATRLSAGAARLQRVDAGLYRILALQAAHAAERPVDAEIADLLAALDGVLMELRTWHDRLPAGDARARVEAVTSDLGTYRGAIEVVGSMLDLDFASAVAFVRPFDGNTRTMLAGLSRLVENAMHEARARADKSTEAAARARRMFAFASVALAIVVASVAFTITRATVQSVGRIAEATVDIARGDSAVDITHLARRDELGAIVESLQAFKDNVSRIAHMAHHDALTGLPNRSLFNNRLQEALTQSRRGRLFALLCLDLDRFKAVNDTLGHPVGDALLCEVAARVAVCVREGDTLARLGGDEFAVIALDVAAPAEAGRIAERIVRTLADLFVIEGNRINIGCSIGIALAPSDGVQAEDLFKNADTALYRAKTEGRNSHRFFEAGMGAQLQWRQQLEIDIRRALVADEFELHYQPFVDVQTMKIRGFEALLRWQHPERGTIPPLDFIPVAEESGLIVELGHLALLRACREATHWPDDIHIAVNLSSVQFLQTNLLQLVFDALDASGLAPQRLELEITESVLLQKTHQTFEMLQALRARGVRIAMDDFGTGYSSLGYLSRFPFDKIKIDQSFVHALADSESAVAIVRAVAGLGKSLGIITTAEGVETEAQFQRLVTEGCTEVQGYLFCHPIPPNELATVLARFGQGVTALSA